jgi:hypothetical protein
MKIFRRGSFFQIPVESVRELTVEQQLARRADELRCELARVNAECASLDDRLANFLRAHKTPDGRYLGASMQELAILPDEEIGMRQAGFILNQTRARILAELSTLTANEKETVHVAGERVSP